MPPSAEITKLLGQTIDGDRLKLARVVGSGSNGVIFLATDLTSGSAQTEYAVKCMVKARIGTRMFALQRQEIDYHYRMSSHPGVVTLHQVLEDKRFIYLVMDFYRRGDFFSFLSKRKDHRGDDEFVKSMLIQIIDVVQACHDAGIFHRDIKPENFLVSDDGSRIFLTDFGLATSNHHSRTYGAGSVLYMSPECIGHNAKSVAYNTRTNDVWAIGVILLTIISGHNPWNAAHPDDPCFAAYRLNASYLIDMLPISHDANRLLQVIFRESNRRVTLPQARRAIVAADTFFMCPGEIVRGGTFLREATEAFFRGSRKEAHFIRWAPSGSSSSTPSMDTATTADTDLDAEVDANLDIDGKHIDRGCREGMRESSAETSAPATPELRAQQMNVEVSESDTIPEAHLDKAIFAPLTRVKAQESESRQSSGRWRRFVQSLQRPSRSVHAVQ